MNSGGTKGGGGMFAVGFLLAAVALYFFFDSVRVSTAGNGWISGALRGGMVGGYGLWNTTSMGIVFLPFLVGVVALFYNARFRWAWYLTWIGLAIIVIEILSRIRFLMSMKTSSLLIMIVAFAAGAGLMLRSYRDSENSEN